MIVRRTIIAVAVGSTILLRTINAFLPLLSPNHHHNNPSYVIDGIDGIGLRHTGFNQIYQASTEADTTLTDERTGKATGVSFLPEDTISRAKEGSPVEKIKLEKDGTSAFVDVYDYARRIREGTMSWEDVEKADLDTVRFVSKLDSSITQSELLFALYSLCNLLVF